MNVRIVAGVCLALVASGCFKAQGEGSGGGAGGGVAAGGGAGGGSEPSVLSLSLSPATATVPIGATLAFTASRVLEDGTVADVTSQVVWTSDPSSVIKVAGGAAQALGAGQARVVATLGAASASALVTVPAATLTSLALSPASISLGAGATVPLSVVGTLSDGTVLELTGQAVFSSSAPALVSVNAAGEVRGLAPGDAVVTARVAGLSATTPVTVTAAKLVSIVVTPSSATLPVGSRLSLRAQGTFDDATVADVTAAAVWSSSAPSVQVAADGTAAALSPGTAILSASLGGQSGTSTVTATAATLVSLEVLPSPLSLSAGQTQQLTATAHFSDNSSLDVTQTASWQSSAPAIAAVTTSAPSRGSLSALTAGSSTITARVGSVSATLAVTVVQAPLISLVVSPGSATLAPGGKQGFTVAGFFTNRGSSDLTQTAVWSSSDLSILSVSNASGSRGQATALKSGQALIRASFGGLSATAQVTVTTAAAIDGLTVAPANVTLAAGAAVPLRAMAHYSDGTLKDLSEQASWVSSAANFATVSDAGGSKGLIRGITNGAATITATLGTFKGTAQVTVSAPTIVALSVAPSSLRLPAGLYEYIEATTAMSDGSTESVSGSASWTSSDANVASVTVYQGMYAYVIANAPGTAVIKASLSTGFSASMTITVTNATLTGVDVGPAQPRLPVGTSQELSATGVFSDQSTADLRYTASWTSSNPAVAQVGNSDYTKGVLTALTPGTTTITVNYQGITGSTVVTVTGATLSTIQVTPFAPKLPVGFTTYLQATGIYSDNTTQDLTYQAGWSSSASSVASVSSWGGMTPSTPGTATITAHFQGVSGTTVVTVTNATLTGLTLTPSNSTVGVQATTPLSASGTFSDGTTMDVTWYVTWFSSNTTVANVSNAWPYQGQVKGLQAGSSMVTAIRGQVSASAMVQVQ